jgi:hypothetical protein
MIFTSEFLVALQIDVTLRIADWEKISDLRSDSRDART